MSSPPTVKTDQRKGKGVIPPPCNGVGAGFGLSAHGQKSDINMHAPEEKREDNNNPSLFCFAAACAPFCLSNEYKYHKTGPVHRKTLQRVNVRMNSTNCSLEMSSG